VQTRDKIKKSEQLIARLEKSKALEKIKQRRADTRRKIEFGGLVIKSGMDAFSKPEILGALSYAQKLINEEPKNLDNFRAIGDKLFLGIDDNERDDT